MNNSFIYIFLFQLGEIHPGNPRSRLIYLGCVSPYVGHLHLLFVCPRGLLLSIFSVVVFFIAHIYMPACAHLLPPSAALVKSLPCAILNVAYVSSSFSVHGSVYQGVISCCLFTNIT